MELPRLLTSFAMAFATTALTIGAAAQSVSLAPPGLPERNPGENHGNGDDRFWISRQDCLDDDAFEFSLQLSGTSNQQLEVWVGEAGTNCAGDDQRTTVNNRCWQVYSGDAGDKSSRTITIPARDIARQEYGDLAALGSAGPEACDQEMPTAGLNLVLFFMLTEGQRVNDSVTYEGIGVDLSGPTAPVDVEVESGDTQLIVGWSFSDSDDWDGYKLFCLPYGPAPDAPPAAELRPQAAPPRGGAGGAAGTGGTAGTAGTAPQVATGGSGTTTGGATATEGGAGMNLIDEECRLGSAEENVLMPGTVPDEEILALECGSGESDTDTEGTAKGLTNYTVYQVAVAGFDRFDNVGPLSAVACGTPVEVDTFYEKYKEAGGTGGGGFCSFTPHRRPQLLALLAGAMTILVARRRRRRHG